MTCMLTLKSESLHPYFLFKILHFLKYPISLNKLCIQSFLKKKKVDNSAITFLSMLFNPVCDC